MMSNFTKLFVALVFISFSTISIAQNITVANIAGEATNIIGGENNRAVLGFNVTSSSAATPRDISSVKVIINQDPSLIFNSPRLIRSTNAVFGDGDDVDLGAMTATTEAPFEYTINFTTIQIPNNATLNFYVAVNINASITTSFAPITLTANASDQGINTTGSISGSASHSYAAGNITALNTAIANASGSTTNTVGGATNQVMLGFSLTSTGNQTFTGAVIGMDDDPDGILSNFRLYYSDNATFDGGDALIASTGPDMVVGTSTITITNLAGQNLTTTTRYYFLVADVTATVDANTIAFTLANSDLTVGPAGSYKSGSANRTVTIAALTSTIANIAASPLNTVGGSADQVMLGFSLTSNGNQEFTGATITVNENPSGKLENFRLYYSADATFDDGDTEIAAEGPSFVVGASSITISSLAGQNISSTRNYFLVADVVASATTSSFTFELTNANLTVSPDGFSKAGSASRTVNVAQLTTTIANAGATSISAAEGTINVPVLGFSLTSNGSQTFTGATINVDVDPDSKLNNFRIYFSTDNTFNVGTDTEIGSEASEITVNPSTIVIAGLAGQNLSVTTRYYFLVADVLSPDPIPPPIQFSLTNANLTVGPAGSFKTGSASKTLTIEALIATLTARPTDDNPVLNGTVLTAGSTERVLAGFSVSSNGTQTLNTVNFTLGNTTSFLAVRLFESTSPTSTGSEIATNANANFGSLSRTITSGETKYYFLVVNVEPGLTSASDNISVNISESGVIFATGNKSTFSISRIFSFNTSQTTTVTGQGNELNPINFADYNKRTESGLTEANTARIFRFRISDNDTDSHPTNINSITLSFVNASQLKSIGLFDGTTLIPNTEKSFSTDLVGNQITFGSLSFAVPDNTNKDIDVRVTFAEQVTDNTQIQVTVSAISATTAGSGIGSFTPFSSSTSGNLNRITVVSTKYTFDPPPSEIVPATNFALTVRATDANGNHDVDRSGTDIDLAISPSGGEISFTSQIVGEPITNRTFSGGMVTWNELRVSPAGTYTISASGSNPAGHTGSVEIQVKSLGVEITTAPNNQSICVQSAQFITLNTITIKERDPGDFKVGTGVTYSIILPEGFVFNTSNTGVGPAVTGPNISAPSNYSYPTNNIARFSYTISGTSGPGLDEIAISNLQVKYTGTNAATGLTIYRIGGTAVQEGNSAEQTDPLAHGTLASTTDNTPVSFIVEVESGFIEPNTVRFSVNSQRIRLRGTTGDQGSTLPGTFTGNGVLQDNQGIYWFYPSQVALGNHTINFLYTDPAAPGCKSVATKIFEVFQSSINNLDREYCINDDASGPMSVNPANLPGGCYIFYDFVWYDWTFGWRVIDNPNNTTFDPKLGIYQTNSYNFVGGIYIGYRVLDICFGGIFVWNYEFATVYQLPSISINPIATAYCDFDAPVNLNGSPSIQNNGFDSFRSVHPITGDPVPGVTGSGTSYAFDPDVALGSSTDPVDVRIIYRYRNEGTTCSNETSLIVTVNPKPTLVPDANIQIGGQPAPKIDNIITNEVCQSSAVPAFQATAQPLTIYRWHTDPTDQSSPFLTGNTFSPSTDISDVVGINSFYISRVVRGCESDNKEIRVKVNEPVSVTTVNSGAFNPIICAGNPVELADMNSSITGPLNTGVWTSNSGNPGVFQLSGGATDNSFTNGNPAISAARYLPSSQEIATGFVELRLSSNDPAGPCPISSDVVFITINPGAEANAGVNQEVCANERINLNGTVTGTTGGTWSFPPGFTGTFVPGAASLATEYVPSEIEKQGSTILFTLTSDDPDGPGPCVPAVSNVQVIIRQQATVNAGADQTLCAGVDVNLNGTVGGPVSTGTWSAWNGDVAALGTFDPSPNDLSAKYIPSSTEQSEGVDLRIRLTTDDPTGPCQSEVDDLRLIVNPIPQEPLSPDPNPYCVNNTILPLTATGSNLRWYNSDNIIPANQVGVGQTFPSGVTSEAAKQVSFYVTQTISNCESPGKEVKIIVNPLPVPNFSAVNFCLGDDMAFTDASTVSNGSIVAWAWRFDDGDELQMNSGNIPAGTHAGRTSGTFNNPLHRYQALGNYNIRLTARSSEGCEDFIQKSFEVGPVPIANFTARNLCENDVTQFNFSSGPASNIIFWDWDFGNPESGSNNTSGLANPSHTFTTVGTFPVKLKLITNLGCEDEITKNTYILPYYRNFTNQPYTADFNDGAQFWVTEGINTQTLLPQTSWNVTVPDGQTITGNNRAWFANVPALNSYNNNERSVVYSPCFDISQLERPLLSFNYWDNTDAGNDGAYIETSRDGGQTWQLLGGIGQGREWYNRQAILGLALQAGIGQGIGQIGWSGNTGGWKDAKFSLEAFKADNKVRLRFVFGSNSDNPDPDLVSVDGFAFDNFFMGERNRIILTEHFNNTNSQNFSTSYTEFQSFTQTYSTELVDLRYHVAFPEPDKPFSKNQNDAGARALYYGIAAGPRNFIDGKLNTIGLNAGLQERLLFESPFALTASLNKGSDDQLIVTLNIKPEFNLEYDTLTLHVAIVENGVSDEGGSNLNRVMRKLLPDAAGTRFIKAWNKDEPAEARSFEWMPTNLSTLSQQNGGANLGVVAFIQHERSREVMQAVYTPLAGGYVSPIVTGIEPGLVFDKFSIYPNPANNFLNVRFTEALREPVNISLTDQLGKMLNKTSLQIGQQETSITTTDFSPGLYFLQIESPSGMKIRQKIIIVH